MTVAVCSFFHAPTGTWSHVVSDFDTRAAAVIDPVLDFDPESGRTGTESAQWLLDHALGHNLRIAWILETHAHADHLTAADWLKRQLGGAPKTGIGKGIVEVQAHFAKAFGLHDFRADGSQFDHLFDDGEKVSLGPLQIEVIATPGHTSDGVTYRIGDALFVGDTLFAPERGTGRCDFPGADAATQFRSIKRLYTFSDETRIFLCHDYPPAGVEPTAQTTVGAQKAGNIQLNDRTRESDYIAFRKTRDATLSPPRLLDASLRTNIRAGRIDGADVRG
jgi:glyoxylase-like metal-dependent hydrolase (beta-lactamase superfamily II)